MQNSNKEMIICLIAGFAIGLLAFYFQFTHFIFSYLTILIHELGHSFFGWIYGYPSIPSFDFTYGGGVACHLHRKIEITYLTYALLILWDFLPKKKFNPISF